MQIKSIILAVILLNIAGLSYSQVVASINASTDFTSHNTAVETSLSYSIIQADSNVKFSKVNYSTSDQKLTLDALEEIQFISLFKDGKYYLTKMPVFSPHLRLSMEHYESGNYQLHLLVKGKIIPTIIEIEKE